MDAFGIRDEGGNPFGGGDIARPASLLVSKEGVLLWSYYADNYRVRPRPSDVLAAASKAIKAPADPPQLKAGSEPTTN